VLPHVYLLLWASTDFLTGHAPAPSVQPSLACADPVCLQAISRASHDDMTLFTISGYVRRS